MNNDEKMLKEMLQGMQENLDKLERKERMNVKNKMSKSKMAGVLTLLAMVLIISGTYAWNNFNQRALNPLSETTNHGGRIHNNYHIADTDLASGSHVKRIFGENFGTSALFVRIRLREFLAVEEVPVGVGPNGVTPHLDNPESWPIYLADSINPNERRVDSDSALIGNRGISLNFGESAADARTLYMPTFNRTSHQVGVNNVTMGTGIYAPPAPFNNNNAFQMSDATGDAIDFVADEATGPTPLNGTHWVVGETYTSRLVVTDHEENGSMVQRVRPGGVGEGGLYTEHTAAPTIDPDATHGSVITIGQWEDFGRPSEGNFWIMDTSDDQGWIYWNGYLNPGLATPLLLNGIDIDPFNESWEYNTTFDAGFFTRTELASMIDNDDISEAAQEIFREPELSIIPAVGEHFMDPDTDVEWRVLADYIDGEHALIITENVWRTSDERFNEVSEFRLFEHSTVIRNQVDNWFDDQVGNRLRNHAVSYRFVNDAGNSIARTELGAGIEIDTAQGLTGPWGFDSNTIWHGNTWRCTEATAFTVPCESRNGINWGRAISRPNPNTEGEAFILSVTEANTFFGDDQQGSLNQYYRVASGGIEHGWGNDGYRHWWLRSSGRSFGNPADGPDEFEPLVKTVVQGGHINNAGRIGNTTAYWTNASLGVRPALWVRR